MKTVRVYELKVKEVSVPEYHMHLDKHFYRENVPLAFVDRHEDKSATLFTETESIPIQEFEECSLPDRYKSQYKGCSVEEIQTHRQYIAIPECLEKLLISPYKDEIGKLKKISDVRLEELTRLQYLMDSNTEGLAKWWSQPWWKRMWSAFRGVK